MLGVFTGSYLDIASHSRPTPELVDRVLRDLASGRNRDDHRINAWLEVGFELGVERLYAYGSFREYVMRVFAIGGRAAEDRIRTARQLASLPAMREASGRGGLHYSVTRELSRVATADNEREWLAASEGKTFREVRRMVSGRSRGDGPTTPKKPEAEVEDVVFRRVDPHARALLTEVRQRLAADSAGPLAEGDVLEAMARAFLEGASSSKADSGRAPYRMSLVVCERCEGAEWEPSGIVASELDVAVAACDAQELGRVDVAGGKLGRATQAIPPKVRRAVMTRHGGRCAVPGCTNSTYVDVHHADLRSEGGTHDPERMLPLCTRHHRAAHEGSLVIGGRFSEGFVFEHADGTRYGSVHARAGRSRLMTQAFGALRGMGFRQKEAQRMVEAARACGAGDFDAVMRAALGAAAMASGVRESIPVYGRAA